MHGQQNIKICTLQVWRVHLIGRLLESLVRGGWWQNSHPLMGVAWNRYGRKCDIDRIYDVLSMCPPRGMFNK